MVRVFVDGKEVKKEDLEHFEIKKESAKRVISQIIQSRVRKEDKE